MCWNINLSWMIEAGMEISIFTLRSWSPEGTVHTSLWTLDCVWRGGTADGSLNCLVPSMSWRHRAAWEVSQPNPDESSVDNPAEEDAKSAQGGSVQHEILLPASQSLPCKFLCPAVKEHGACKSLCLSNYHRSASRNLTTVVIRF